MGVLAQSSATLDSIHLTGPGHRRLAEQVFALFETTQ